MLSSVESALQDDEIYRWAHDLPKIALHRHLEGSLRLETLADIAVSHDIPLPAYTVDTLRPHVQMLRTDPTDFHHYIGKFRLLRRFYASKDIIQRVAREAVLDAAADNVRYLELRFNPVALSKVHGFGMDEVVGWVVASVEATQALYDIRVCLILQIGREEPLRIANEIVDIAIAHHGPLVRAVDLAGDEVHYPPENFAAPFRRAREAGLHITVHAGEALGPRSVEGAVKALGAERIGHGIRSVEDPRVVRMLREREVTLEVCPTSNFQTGVVQDPAKHPLRPLYERGVRVTVNTDNPSISATSVSREYVVAIRDVGLTRAAIRHTLGNAIAAAFIPDEERDWLRACITPSLSWLR